MDIDFIKWMCEKAEGFFVLNQEHDERIQLPSRDQLDFEELCAGSFYELHIYPFLLQRAIEGVNKKYESWEDNNYFEIRFNNENYYILNGSTEEIKYFWFEDYDSIDQAKEAALKYIYEQEK